MTTGLFIYLFKCVGDIYLDIYLSTYLSISQKIYIYRALRSMVRIIFAKAHTTLEVFLLFFFRDFFDIQFIYAQPLKKISQDCSSQISLGDFWKTRGNKIISKWLKKKTGLKNTYIQKEPQEKFYFLSTEIFIANMYAPRDNL